MDNMVKRIDSGDFLYNYEEALVKKYCDEPRLFVEHPQMLNNGGTLVVEKDKELDKRARDMLMLHYYRVEHALVGRRGLNSRRRFLLIELEKLNDQERALETEWKGMEETELFRHRKRLVGSPQWSCVKTLPGTEQEQVAAYLEEEKLKGADKQERPVKRSRQETIEKIVIDLVDLLDD